MLVCLLASLQATGSFIPRKYAPPYYYETRIILRNLRHSRLRCGCVFAFAEKEARIVRRLLVS